MRSLLLAYGEPLVCFLCLAELVLGLLMLRRSRSITALLMAAVTLGLALDGAIQALGVLFGEGSFLQGLSQVRYILHGILVPPLIPIAFYAYGIRSKTGKCILWAVTGVIIVAGIVMGCLVRTMPADVAGVLRYAEDKEATPAFAAMMERLLSFGGVIPLMVVGLAHLLRHKRVWLLLSGAAMFVFAALAPATHNMDLTFLLTMCGEALMAFFFLLELPSKKK